MKPAKLRRLIGLQAFFQHQSEYPMKYGMNWRWFVVGGGARGMVASVIGPAMAASEDPVALVRSVYTRAATPGSNALPERDFLALLSADLRKAWQAARPRPGHRRRAAARGGVRPQRRLRPRRDGQDASPIFPACRRSASSRSSSPVGTETRQVFVHLAPDAESWTIVNIIYDEGDDFRHSAEQLAQTAG